MFTIKCMVHRFTTQCMVCRFTTKCIVYRFTTQCMVHRFTTNCMVHRFTTKCMVHRFTKKCMVHRFTTKFVVHRFIAQCMVLNVHYNMYSSLLRDIMIWLYIQLFIYRFPNDATSLTIDEQFLWGASLLISPFLFKVSVYVEYLF